MTGLGTEWDVMEWKRLWVFSWAIEDDEGEGGEGERREVWNQAYNSWKKLKLGIPVFPQQNKADIKLTGSSLTQERPAKCKEREAATGSEHR
jgi:hypothetical protein